MNLLALRLKNQRLLGDRLDDPAQVVSWLGAVQSQDYAGAKWALGLRLRASDDAGIDRAFNAGAILRLHIMRPTWHFVTPADIRWLLRLTSPRVHAANAHMYRRLELDDDVLGRACDRITAALQGGRAATRQELAAVLEAAHIPARGQRLAYIVMYAELSGLLCSGPLRGRQHTYALLEERVPPAPALADDEALVRLATRYFASHGPATVHDFAWWSGLRVSDARSAVAQLGAGFEQVVVGGRTFWTPAPARAVELEATVIHLLPNYDEHFVSERDKDHILDPAARKVLPQRTDGPLDKHIVARNGLIVGGWQRTLTPGSVSIALDLLAPLRRGERGALRRAVDDYRNFIGADSVTMA